MGSNPTAALVLVVLLTALRFLGEQIKEAIMNKKAKKSKSEVRADKRCVSKSASIVTHFFETAWAMGAGVAAAMAISTSAHQAGR